MSATPVLKMETPRDWASAGVKIAEAVAATAAAHAAEESFVADNFAKLRDAGLLAAPVPAELGGGGIDYRTLCSVVRRSGTRCGSTALAFSMHAHLVATAAWRWKHQQAPTDGLLRRVAAENLVLVSSGGSG